MEGRPLWWLLLLLCGASGRFSWQLLSYEGKSIRSNTPCKCARDDFVRCVCLWLCVRVYGFSGWDSCDCVFLCVCVSCVRSRPDALLQEHFMYVWVGVGVRVASTEAWTVASIRNRKSFSDSHMMNETFVIPRMYVEVQQEVCILLRVYSHVDGVSSASLWRSGVCTSEGQAQ